MKCYVLLIDRGNGILYRKAEYSGNAGIYKTGFKSKGGFFIPDKTRTIFIKGLTGLDKLRTLPLWVVNGRTGIALSFEEVPPENLGVKAVKQEIPKSDELKPIMQKGFSKVTKLIEPKGAA